MQEGRHDGVPDMVMLTVGIQTSRWPKRGIGCWGTTIAERAGCANETHDRQGAEAQLDAKRHENGGDDWHGRERRADANRDEQTDQKHQQGADGLAVADPRGGCVYQQFHLTGFTHHFSETSGGNHDEADHGHHFHAVGKRSSALASAPHRRPRRSRTLQVRRESSRPQLNNERRSNGNACHHQGQWAVTYRTGLHLLDASKVIFTRLVVAIEGDRQPRQHAQSWDQHRLGDLDAGYIHTAFGNVGQQNLIQEDVAEPNRKKHVRSDQPEREHTGNQAPVDLHLRQYVK